MKPKYSITLLLLCVCFSLMVSAQEQNKTNPATSGVQSEQNPIQKAQNNNTVRSNRTEGKAAIDNSVTQDNNAASSKKGYDYYKAQSDMNSAKSATSTTKAQDHNSSRSNKTASTIDNGNGSGTEKKRVNKVDAIGVKHE